MVCIGAHLTYRYMYIYIIYNIVYKDSCYPDHKTRKNAAERKGSKQTHTVQCSRRLLVVFLKFNLDY